MQTRSPDGLLLGPALCTLDGERGYGLVEDGALAWRAGQLPGRWVRGLLLASVAALTFLRFRTIVGYEAGVTFIVMLLALKTLELRARRDNANNVSAVKEAMAQLGLCERTVRPPISELPNGEREEVREILRLLEISA